MNIWIIIIDAHESIGEYMDMWIDKMCIPGRDSIDYWQYTPLFISMCDRMILLAGCEYPTRIWTLLEPFILYVNERNVDRILLIPLEKEKEKEKESENVFIKFERLSISKCSSFFLLWVF